MRNSNQYSYKLPDFALRLLAIILGLACAPQDVGNNQILILTKFSKRAPQLKQDESIMLC